MKERIHLFDIIKGFFICMVIIGHFPLPNSFRASIFYNYVIEMTVPFFMMVSGYLMAVSMDKKNIDTFEKAYSFSMVVPQLIRFLIPYTVIFAVFTGYCVYKGYYMSVATKMIEYVTGSIGPGGYYFPLLIQLVFLFPVIYFILKKNPNRGLVTLFFMSFAYEFIQRTYNMDGEFYRLVVLRYILHIGLGAYVYLKKENVAKWGLLMSFVIGVVYIYIASYTDYQPKIIRYWTNTSFVAALFCFPIFYLMVRYLKKIKCWPVEVIGRASYNIFLFQAVYYSFFCEMVMRYVSDRVVLFFACCAICLGTGLVFYLVESQITKRVVSLLKNPLKMLDSKI